jgi:hypothetical protein
MEKIGLAFEKFDNYNKQDPNYLCGMEKPIHKNILWP